jgi:K(+)-stimulated pyrophosphate-energized sodium pump
MAIAGFGILFSIIGTLLVKITDENAKEAQVQSVKYWKLGFYWINSYCLLLLVQYMLPANMKMEFFGRDARHFVDESFLCYVVGLVVGAVISSVTEYYRIGNKTSYGYSSKIKYWSRD